MKPKSIKLLDFDKDHNLQYQGKCKLRIDKLSSMLIVEPENEECKMISAMFKWNFVMDKNILFVFGEHELSDFALVFDEEKRCKKVYDFIFKDKTQSDTGREMLINRFLLPICNRLSQNDECALMLKKILLQWIAKHEDKEQKKEYIQLLKDNNVYDFVFSSNTIAEASSPNISIVQIDTDSYKSSIQGKRRHSQLESTHKSRDNSDMPIQFKKQKSLKTLPQIVNEKLFKIVHVQHYNRSWRKLLIFTNSDMKRCYEYSWSDKKKLYFCNGCRYGRKNVTAVLEDENGLKSVKPGGENHICNPLPYNSNYYVETKIFKKPDYQILENCNTVSGKILIVFNESDKSKCWEFRTAELQDLFRCLVCKTTTAKLKNTNTEYECIEIKNGNHRCRTISYSRENYYEFNEFVLSPDYEVQTVLLNGEERKRLIIFDKNNRNLCHVYSLDKNNNCSCMGCKKIKKSYVPAKLVKNTDGEEYVLLQTKKHVCELRRYSDVLKKEETIIRSSDFVFMENTDNGIPKLFIFDSNDRNQCFVFTFDKQSENKYTCQGCAATRSTLDITVHLKKDENGEEYFIHVYEKHVCQPIKVSSICAPEFIMLERNEITFKEKEKKKPEIDESKIVKSPFFEIRPNKRGIPDASLIILPSENRKLTFEYVYNKGSKSYSCCERRVCHASAKLHIDENGEKYILLGKAVHKCMPAGLMKLL